jgi:transposase
VIQVAPGTKVYLACRPVSMRYCFDGLAAQAKQVLDADPFICVGHKYVAVSRHSGIFAAAGGLGRHIM